VISIQIYDHVESLQYTEAHTLAAGMVLFSFLVLVFLRLWQDKHSNFGVVR
jgi:molybdate transport system permease protein